MNKCYLNFRTDLADERVDVYKRVNNLTDIDGIKVTENTDKISKTVTVDVLNENGSNVLKKDIGKYITIEVRDMKYLEENDKVTLINNIAKQILDLIGDKKSVIIIGLGNMYVTPDALGPKVVKYVNVNRHLFKYAKEYVDNNSKQVSAISPGVMGTTGIETEEIVESVVKRVEPDIVIVIDSLSSSSVNRVGTTIQISNTGITPGAGVKNQRASLNEKTLNVPVIAIGVPTVVDMATITNEAIDKMLENSKFEIDNLTNIKDSDEVFNLLNKDNRYNMISNILNTENYIVTPKEIDDIIDKISEIIASSINVSMN